MSYLFMVPNPLIIMESILGKPYKYDIYGSGRPLHPNIDVEIESSPEVHVSDPKFNIPVVYRGNRIKETLDELREIKNISDQNNIQILFFINPIHRTTYLASNSDEFNDFKMGLANISSYYDFSGINTITSNNYYYYETSHYRSIVGDMIIAKLFSKKDVYLPSDFGIWVEQH